MKVNTLFLTVLLTIICYSAKSQRIDTLYNFRHIDNFQEETIASVNDKLNLRYNSKKELVYTYIDGVLIDSLSYDMGTVLEYKFLITINDMFICDYDPKKKANVLRKIDINNGKCEEIAIIDTLDIQGKYNNRFLAKGDYRNNLHNIQRLYFFDPKELNVKLLYDFRELISWESTEGYEPMVLSAYNSDRGKKLFIETGMPAGGGIDDLFYFILDMETGTVRNETNNPDYRQFTHSDGYELHKFIPDVSDSFFHVQSSYTNEATHQSIPRGFILDKDFQVIARMLPKQYTIYGYNYENGKLQSLILGSNTDHIKSKYDGLQDVTFNYVPDYIFEKALYAIYHNQELNKAIHTSEFSQLDEYQLSILKNMVFAKHNYAFDNEFYQAFFNLFDFYNTEEQRKTRTKEINDALSYHDRQNLKQISNALTRLK